MNRPIKKMNRNESVECLKKEIVKCWDDGEVATYDSLLQLCSQAGANTATEVFSSFSFLNCSMVGHL